MSIKKQSIILNIHAEIKTRITIRYNKTMLILKYAGRCQRIYKVYEDIIFINSKKSKEMKYCGKKLGLKTYYNKNVVIRHIEINHDNYPFRLHYIKNGETIRINKDFIYYKAFRINDLFNGEKIEYTTDGYMTSSTYFINNKENGLCITHHLYYKKYYYIDGNIIYKFTE